jgi:hypothetical protein
MDGSNTKISFIPKGPLTREESFLERKRPRSVIGFLAAFVFLASVGAYTALYFYDTSLVKKITDKNKDIQDVQNRFSDSSEVVEAKVFRARADLAKELLLEHVAVSPIFTFLSENTLESIVYEKFSFTRGVDGLHLVLVGEAPTYASLAYQADRLREKTKELKSFSIDNGILTSFGTVTFTLKMVFAPSYLSYAGQENTQSTSSALTPQYVSEKRDARASDTVAAPVTSASPVSGSPEALMTPPVFSQPDQNATSSVSPVPVLAPPTVATTSTSMSFMSTVKSWWLRFKFW